MRIEIFVSPWPPANHLWTAVVARCTSDVSQRWDSCGILNTVHDHVSHTLSRPRHTSRETGEGVQGVACHGACGAGTVRPAAFEVWSTTGIRGATSLRAAPVLIVRTPRRSVRKCVMVSHEFAWRAALLVSAQAIQTVRRRGSGVVDVAVQSTRMWLRSCESHHNSISSRQLNSSAGAHVSGSTHLQLLDPCQRT